MREIILGSTGITVKQNAFGALPIQRDPQEVAVDLLRKAYEGGMRFFDTARAYSDSEEKVGIAFAGMREKVFIATKTMAKTKEQFWEQLETSLKLLQTDYIDIYQFHCVEQCYQPRDGTGMYECMLEAKKQGKIKHIGAPSQNWLSESMQADMKKIEGCTGCGACKKHCPYSLDTPTLLKKNYEDYKRVLAGEVTV